MRRDDPAFPSERGDTTNIYDSASQTYKTIGIDSGGMTIRERFVMAAMQGLCANTDLVNEYQPPCGYLSECAITIADAVLNELEKEK